MSVGDPHLAVRRFRGVCEHATTLIRTFGASRRRFTFSRGEKGNGHAPLIEDGRCVLGRQIVFEALVVDLDQERDLL